MKRKLCLLLMLVLLFGPCGCRVQPDTQGDILFYYPLANALDTPCDSILGAETREDDLPIDSLSGLVTAYLAGPADLTLVNPFPGGTTVLSAQIEDTTAVITLSEAFDSLTELEMRVACAGLSKTLIELTACQAVSVTTEARISGGLSPIVMDDTSFILTEDAAPAATGA